MSAYFIDIWNKDRENYSNKRGWTYDDRMRREPLLYNMDIIELFPKWDKLFYSAGMLVDSSYWTKLRATIKNGELSTKQHLIYNEYEMFWATIEEISKQLDAKGLKPKSSFDVSKFIIIGIAGVALLIFVKRK